MWTKNAELFSFADDTTSVVSHADLDAACELATMDAERIMGFMTSNFLVANQDKTKLLIFDPNRSAESQAREIVIGGNVIVETTCEKLLGLHVSNDLRWTDHIQQTKTSLRYRICMLKRLAHSLPHEHLRQLADGLVLSKIRYGLAVYSSAVRTSEQDPIDGMIQTPEVVVNDVMRIIEGVRRKDRVSIHELRKKTNVPSVNQMAAQAIITDAWKIAHNKVAGLEDIFTQLNEAGMKTRAKTNGNFKVPFGSQMIRRSFSHQGAVLWNALPQEIRESEAIHSAKKKIRAHVQSYP